MSLLQDGVAYSVLASVCAEFFQVSLSDGELVLWRAGRWVANINKRIFSDFIAPPQTWVTAAVRPQCPADNTGPVSPVQGAITPPDHVSVPDAADHSQGHASKRRRKCPVPDTVPAAPSLDQQQIAALQQLNSKLREKLQNAEAANAKLAEQLVTAQTLREEAVAKVSVLEKQNQALQAQVQTAEEKMEEDAATMHEMRALHTAMEMRVGIVVRSCSRYYMCCILTDLCVPVPPCQEHCSCIYE